MTFMPCPHARYNAAICPHCNGTNDAAYQQLEIEAPVFTVEIVEKDEPSTGSSVTIIDISGGDADL